MMFLEPALQLIQLVAALEVRQVQLSRQMQGDEIKYPISTIHHMRDIMTVLAFLKGEDNMDELLRNMPNANDLPINLKSKNDDSKDGADND